MDSFLREGWNVGKGSRVAHKAGSIKKEISLQVITNSKDGNGFRLYSRRGSAVYVFMIYTCPPLVVHVPQIDILAYYTQVGFVLLALGVPEYSSFDIPLVS